MAKPKKENSHISIAIKRIKQLSFFINEHAFRENASDTKIGFDLRFGCNHKKKYVEIVIRATYKYPEDKDYLVGCEVQNIFEVLELRTLRDKEGNLKMPKNILVMLVGISISHTRAVLSPQLMDTPFRDNIIPIIEPEPITKHFFGEDQNGIYIIKIANDPPAIDSTVNQID